MGETVASNPALQVSVSFGRFENDSLSWEKWSAFSPNKYLEEVEKCATPGSVAQKKAYFEAHYKNVAARKAELLAQEKQMEKDPLRSQYQTGEELSRNTCGTDEEFDVHNTQGSSEGAKQETNSTRETIATHVGNSEEDVAVSRDYQSSSVEGENEELESRSRGFQMDKHEEVVCIEQEGKESATLEAESVKEISHHVDNETAKALEIEAKHVTLDHPKISKKFEQVTPLNREGNVAKMKKKSKLPSSKASEISTPKSSKPASSPTKTLSSASTKRGNSSSISGRKITSTGENRNVPNKSLHMSLSLAPSKHDPAPLTTLRKSLIMEKMGDKDIVKRAFKTFQNNFNQPKISDEDKSLVKEKVPSRGTEPRLPTSIALRKENGQSPKVDSADKRGGNVLRTTLGIKSDIRAEKGKESPRKIEEKINAKEVERTHVQLKSKEEKLKHNFKATPVPTFQRGQKVSKSHPEKGNAKIEKWR
ncbi:protein WVD2-like 7 isoform X2 [Abrus precatorius]|uniref:Protein WVD2-like 7 isoform X2 n=1 Tax=Abrus precatorius TaxID=3816 RepID=A0A8B8KSB2_ABRPR|nr:protein WVD2-like 7 isoform X2 [Abrus precatorius]XP_027346754.1 protein WVD2-like 7 isoform X2 [Abrus precatorius]XP_027346757.1 protein WVD2-like 7 isoform X2 [Abrus precatorius]